MKRLLLLLSVVTFSLAGCRKERSEAATPSHGSVIIISVDTLRADHLPLYGYKGVKTPAIDALARDGMTFENAYAQVPLTLPSHVSMLTGELPASNGVRNNLGYPFDAAAHETIPSMLKKAGYATGGAVSAYVLRGSTGLSAAFDHYDDAMDTTEGPTVGELQRAGPRTVAVAEAWIDANRARPLFFLLHLFEPHAPYDPPEPFKTEYQGREYDGEIAAADSMIGDFIGFLKKSGLYDGSTIVFMSDHGEGLGDHGESQHGIFLYREAIRVPLVLKLPGAKRRGERVAAPVGLVDLLPTIAALSGAPPPEKLAGRSLLDVADGKVTERRIFSETMYPRIHLGLSGLASLVDSTYHYIDAPRAELYDVRGDPGEKENVLGGERRVAASMKREIASFDRSLAAPAAISPEEVKKLAALGYLSAPVAGGAGRGDPKDHIQDLEAAARAADLIRAGQPDEAIGILQGVLSRNPGFADGWSELGDAFVRAGRIEEAVAAYRKTIEVSPMLASDTAISLAESYLSLGRIDESIRHAMLALPAHPGAAHAVLAKAYLAKKNVPSAEREAQWLLDDPSSHVSGMIAMAQVRVAQRRFDDALALAAEGRRELGRGQPLPMLAFVEGDALARKGNFAAAEQAFMEETKAFPRNREAYARLAALQTLQGREADADQTLQRMVRASPEPSSYTLAAGVMESLGRHAAAERWRGKAN